VHRWLLLVALAACKRHEAAPATHGDPSPATHRDPDVVAKTTMPITIDGDWDEHDWPARAFRAQFVGDDGNLARPSSEVRMLHDGQQLFVALYAADENIETRDAFDLTVGDLSLHVDARGNVSVSGVRAKSGFDEGTIDDAHDDDEEWVVELAIPLARVGPSPLPVKVSRCDVPKDGIQRCGHWSGRVRLE